MALIGALAVLADLHVTPHEVATLARKLETDELGIQSGVQDQIARGAGAMEFKINGAGGGGSVTLLCASDNTRAVETAVKEAGFRVLPCRLDSRGLKTWVTRRDGRGTPPMRRSRTSARRFEVEAADRAEISS